MAKESDRDYVMSILEVGYRDAALDNIKSDAIIVCGDEHEYITFKAKYPNNLITTTNKTRLAGYGRMRPFIFTYNSIMKLLSTAEVKTKRSTLMSKVTKTEEFDGFQLTEENSLNNIDWPRWMHEAWNREPYQQHSVGRRNQYHPGTTEIELAVRYADTWVPVRPGDWILRDQHGHLTVRDERVFNADYRVVDDA